MFFITKFEHNFLTGRVKTFAQTSFLEAWQIHKTLLKPLVRNKSDKNQPSKFIHLGKSPPIYYTHFENCYTMQTADRLKFL